LEAWVRAALLVALVVSAAGCDPCKNRRYWDVYDCGPVFSRPDGGICGDGVCDDSEEFETCPIDCTCDPDCVECGDGECDASESDSCPEDCGERCGNLACGEGEDVATCPLDCSVCGDGLCTPIESPGTCADDCGERCNDGTCDEEETVETCPMDCSVCGDGDCSLYESCPDDCAA
jgi:hypothetical protein